MADCSLLGDSIAVGLGAVLHARGWLCLVAARTGASSADLVAQIGRSAPHAWVLVSAGTNDRPGASLEANLLAARMAIGRGQVVWLLPYHRRTAYTVTQIAFRFGDEVVDLARFPTRDHIHPASYREVARALQP